MYTALDRHITQEHAAALASGHGYALQDTQGVFAIGGLYPLRPSVAMAWTLLGRRWRRYARLLTAFCVDQMDSSPYARVEAATLADWPQGAHWLKRMGFYVETERAVRWDGQTDYALFTRIKGT